MSNEVNCLSGLELEEYGYDVELIRKMVQHLQLTLTTDFILNRERVYIEEALSSLYPAKE